VTTTRRWRVETRDAFLPASLEAGDDERTNQDDWTRNVAAVSPRTGGEMCIEVCNSPIGSRGRHETRLSETAGCHGTLSRNRFGGRPGEVLVPTAAASALRPGRARGLEGRCTLMCTTALLGRVDAEGRGRVGLLTAVGGIPETGSVTSRARYSR
jgi:hypothetical protein